MIIFPLKQQQKPAELIRVTAARLQQQITTITHTTHDVNMFTGGRVH